MDAFLIEVLDISPFLKYCLRINQIELMIVNKLREIYHQEMYGKAKMRQKLHAKFVRREVWLQKCA